MNYESHGLKSDALALKRLGHRVLYFIEYSMKSRCYLFFLALISFRWYYLKSACSNCILCYCCSSLCYSFIRSDPACSQAYSTFDVLVWP